MEREDLSPVERESITLIKFWKKNPEAILFFPPWFIKCIVDKIPKKADFCQYLKKKMLKKTSTSIFDNMYLSCKSEIWFKLWSYLNATLARDWSELGEHLELYLVLQKFLITFPSNQKTFGSKAILVLLIDKNQHLTKVWFL